MDAAILLAEAISTMMPDKCYEIHPFKNIVVAMAALPAAITSPLYDF